jgi:hypothetical protein
VDRVPLAAFETAQPVRHGRQLGRGMRPRRAERRGWSNSPSRAHDGLEERWPFLRIAFPGQDILAHAAVAIVTAVYPLAPGHVALLSERFLRARPAYSYSL